MWFGDKDEGGVVKEAVKGEAVTEVVWERRRR